MDVSLLERVNQCRAAREVCVVVTTLETGAKDFLRQVDLTGHVLAEEFEKRVRSGKSGLVEHGGAELFVEVHVPPPRLVVIGAVHISQALYPMAQACGFDVTIIDPRTAFATEERFKGVALHADWPEEILPHVPFDAHTAVVALTHDPKIDDYPLKAALDAGCFYVGALGSRKTHSTRLERLKAADVQENDLDSIHAPIGLDIGASSPAEIAVAVLAEVIAALRKSA